MKKKGFTLIELLVVIAIIGLLATLSVVALNNARERARDSRRVSDIKQIQTALELYYNENDKYPVQTTLAEAHIATGLDGTGAAGINDFINPIPEAPTPVDGDCTDVLGDGTNNGNKYGYISADGSTYSLHYCLGSATGGLNAGKGTATPMKFQ